MKKKKVNKKNIFLIRVVFICLFLVLLIYNLQYLKDTQLAKEEGKNRVDHTGTWIKCDEANVGIIQEINGMEYKCIQENNQFKWIHVSEKQNKEALV